MFEWAFTDEHKEFNSHQVKINEWCNMYQFKKITIYLVTTYINKAMKKQIFEHLAIGGEENN